MVFFLIGVTLLWEGRGTGGENRERTRGEWRGQGDPARVYSPFEARTKEGILSKGCFKKKNAPKSFPFVGIIQKRKKGVGGIGCCSIGGSGREGSTDLSFCGLVSIKMENLAGQR